MKTRILILSVLALTGTMAHAGITYTDNGDGTVTKTEQIVVDKVNELDTKNARLQAVRDGITSLNDRKTMLLKAIADTDAEIVAHQAEEQEILAEIAELGK